MKKYLFILAGIMIGTTMSFAAGKRKYITPVHHISISTQKANLLRNNSVQEYTSNDEIELLTVPSEVDVNIPITTHINDRTFAVVIGNEIYRRVAKVPFAVNDCRVVAEYFEKTLGIPSDHIRKLENATLNDMREAIDWLTQVMEAYNGEARVIFYYAGHGIPEESSKSAYLLPVDGYGTNVQTGYKLEDLYSTLSRYPARNVTIFLDACFSGAKRSEGGEMLASARGVAIKSNPGQPQGSMVVMTAAKDDETAYPLRQEGHGMFTYYLLEKLQLSYGDVYLGELSEYISNNVKKQSIVTNGKIQTPTITSSKIVGDEWRGWKLQ